MNIGISKTLKEEIINKIFKKCGKKTIKAIVLFGSRARGDFNDDSDYDINVFTKRKIVDDTLSDFKHEIHVDFIDNKRYKLLNILRCNIIINSNKLTREYLTWKKY